MWLTSMGRPLPQRTQEYLSRRFAARRARDHQWFFQNAFAQRSRHHMRRPLGRGVAHQEQTPAPGRASAQDAISAALLVMEAILSTAVSGLPVFAVLAPNTANTGKPDTTFVIMAW